MSSLTEIAQRFGVFDSPISIRKLMNETPINSISLRDIEKQIATLKYEASDIKAGDVFGSAVLGISSSGHWSFKGDLFDSADWIGDTFALVFALNYVDQSGKVYVAKQEGKIGAHFLGPKNRISWEQNGYDPFIENNWNNIRVQGFQWKIEVGSDPAQIFEAVVSGIAIAGGAILVVASLLGGKKPGSDTNCRWVADPGGGNQGPSESYHCD
jgi:hypothetical protein